MDGENNGKTYVLMDDLGGNTPIFGNTHIPPFQVTTLTPLEHTLKRRNPPVPHLWKNSPKNACW